MSLLRKYAKRNKISRHEADASELEYECFIYETSLERGPPLSYDELSEYTKWLYREYDLCTRSRWESEYKVQQLWDKIFFRAPCEEIHGKDILKALEIAESACRACLKSTTARRYADLRKKLQESFEFRSQI
jgi:hypothetical protein